MHTYDGEGRLKSGCVVTPRLRAGDDESRAHDVDPEDGFCFQGFLMSCKLHTSLLVKLVPSERFLKG